MNAAMCADKSQTSGDTIQLLEAFLPNDPICIGVHRC
jgi:hypothetical protein